MATIKLTVDSEFIKLARQFLKAKKDADLSPNPRSKRSLENLERLFDAKLSAYEKQVAAMEEQASKAGGNVTMFDLKKVN